MRVLVGGFGNALVSILQAHTELSKHFHGLPDDIMFSSDGRLPLVSTSE
jgi:hypothetical protein